MNDLEGFLGAIGCDRMVEREGSGADRYGTKIICTCPLHDDSSPSFMLRTEDPYYWNCFVCGKGAGLVNLAMRAKGINKSEAVKLVKRYVTIGEHFLRRPVTGPRVLKTYPEAALAAYQGKYKYLAHWYMSKRGFLSHILTEHDIGYDWRKKRVTMPVRHPDGSIVAIMGRALSKRNKPRHLVYEGVGKETLLLGSHDINKEGDIYVVEGQFDYLKLKQYGCQNVIALLNSKITDYQFNQLLSYGRKIRLFLDNDNAGANGAVYIINKCKDKVPVAVPCYGEDDSDPCELSYDRFKELDTGAVSPWKKLLTTFT